MAEHRPHLTLLNNTYPYLRIAMTDGTYETFQGGRLELEPDNPHYDEVRAEAERNPTIVVQISETTCALCGENFTGPTGSARLGGHTKRVHPEVWDAQKQLESATAIARRIKEAAGVVCEVCTPIQEFGTTEDLTAHVRLLHTAPPRPGEADNEADAGRRPGEVVPAARPTS